MQSESCEHENEWKLLKTITTFDGLNVEMPSNDDGQDLTQLLDGSLINIFAAEASTPVSLLVQSLVQQLCTMLETNPKRSEQLYNTICDRLHAVHLIDATYSMGEFAEMRCQYQKALYQLVSIARGEDFPSTLQSVWPLAEPAGLEWSRYHNEFIEIELIAAGGFGRVYKARHKLDGMMYAIKKVTIKSTTVNRIMSHLAEVKTLASLNHPNIVPYKAAWLEPLLSNKREPIGALNVDNNNEGTVESSVATTADQTDWTHRDSDGSSDFIQFERSNDDPPRAIVEYKQSIIQTSKPHLKLRWATLYVQMYLCRMTLREWLDQRNRSDSIDSLNHGRVMEIFAQLLAGLTYIHDRGIVHHDIKPSNVFVNSTIDKDCNGGEILVQLGDFGLACPLQNCHADAAVFGTPLYAAPEQLNGECDPKSDVFSLGIIFLELLLKFSTDMERVKTIEAARGGQLPSGLTRNCITLLKRMFQPLADRPNCSELFIIFNELQMTPAHSVPALQRRLSERDYEIQTLRSQVADNRCDRALYQSVNFELEARESEILYRIEELRTKDQEIMALRREVEGRQTELQRKDAEIHRLKRMLEANIVVKESNSDV